MLKHSNDNSDGIHWTWSSGVYNGSHSLQPIFLVGPQLVTVRGQDIYVTRI